jgi:hypothetical protein
MSYRASYSSGQSRRWEFFAYGIFAGIFLTIFGLYLLV